MKRNQNSSMQHFWLMFLPDDCLFTLSTRNFHCISVVSYLVTLRVNDPRSFEVCFSLKEKPSSDLIIGINHL